MVLLWSYFGREGEGRWGFVCMVVQKGRDAEMITHNPTAKRARPTLHEPRTGCGGLHRTAPRLRRGVRAGKWLHRTRRRAEGMAGAAARMARQGQAKPTSCARLRLPLGSRCSCCRAVAAGAELTSYAHGCARRLLGPKPRPRRQPSHVGRRPLRSSSWTSSTRSVRSGRTRAAATMTGARWRSCSRCSTA